MYYVYFARGYANEDLVAECRTMEAACARADEEYANGSRDIEVYVPRSIRRCSTSSSATSTTWRRR